MSHQNNAIDRKSISMVDLKSQYTQIKDEIDNAVIKVIESTQFINGYAVKEFQQDLEAYLQVKHVIPCANGTDALQIALMALDLVPGDEVIVPAFTYVATAEVIGLLRLSPVMVDVDPASFNLDTNSIEAAITPRTKAIVPVHLFGQSADMEKIMDLANRYNLYVIEDNAQAIGADFTFSNGVRAKTGTIGHIGCTSFFPSKNLGCFGDGGAIFTNDDQLASKIRMIANHGQSRRYYHDEIGVNSRLDSIQAAILQIKLKHLDQYNLSRLKAADYYDSMFAQIEGITIPHRVENSTHVFHQYTLKINGNRRDALVDYVSSQGIPCMIYYPVPLYEQKAFNHWVAKDFYLPITHQLCQEVFSLPMHSELTKEIKDEIIGVVQEGVKAVS